MSTPICHPLINSSRPIGDDTVEFLQIVLARGVSDLVTRTEEIWEDQEPLRRLRHEQQIVLLDWARQWLQGGFLPRHQAQVQSMVSALIWAIEHYTYRIFLPNGLIARDEPRAHFEREAKALAAAAAEMNLRRPELSFAAALTDVPAERLAQDWKNVIDVMQKRLCGYRETEPDGSFSDLQMPVVRSREYVQAAMKLGIFYAAIDFLHEAKSRSLLCAGQGEWSTPEEKASLDFFADIDTAIPAPLAAAQEA